MFGVRPLQLHDPSRCLPAPAAATVFLLCPYPTPCPLTAQFYCDSSDPTICQAQPNAVAISNVSYSRITGTSNGTRGVVFNCSDTVPCLDILLTDINIVQGGTKSLVSLYRNAFGNSFQLVSPNTPGVTFMPLPVPPDQAQAFASQVLKCRYVGKCVFRCTLKHGVLMT